MSEPAFVTITMRDGAPTARVRPGRSGVTAAVSGGERSLRVSLRGRGDVAVVFRGIDVADVDVRGGFAVVEPGAPCVVRAAIDGWLSLTARLRRPRGRAALG